METFKDYYRTLRVHPTADDVTIKAAFRRLALKYHPDVARNQRAARWFPNVQEAYAVLADPEKRREYDRVYRDRKPVRPTLSASRKRRERDSQAAGRFGRLDEARELMGALGEVVERGVTRNVRLHPGSASGEVIPTTLNASALRGSGGEVIGVVGILRDMRELDKARAYAESLIKNAPDPVFVSDLQGKILQANDAVYTLLGFRKDEVLEQSLSRFISVEETREFMAALREVVARGVTRNARLNPRSASGEIIPTTLNASALRDPDGTVIGAIGILR